MRPLSREQYAALLERYVAHLDAEIAALQPSGWPVAALGESYAAARVHAELIGVWEVEKRELAFAAWKAAQDRRYAHQKLAHMYV